MRRQFLVVVGAVAAVVVVSLVPVLVGAQAPTATAGATRWTPPHTPWGDPDLQGEWSAMTTTPLQRPTEGREVITDPEELARRFDADPALTGGGVGSYNAFWREYGEPVKGRTHLIVDPPDGRIPPLTPDALKRPATPGDRADGPEDRSLHERCINWEVVSDSGVNVYYRIVQTPGYVAINHFRLHDMRIIPLDRRPHLPQDVRQWVGDSRGRWEGNTLVVDITNFSDKTDYRGARGNLHVIERFTRVDADTINYEAALEDPTTWTRPWRFAKPLRKDTGGFYEYACHEGNHAMVGLLNGARTQEKAAGK